MKVYQTRGVVPPWTMLGKQLVLLDHHGADGNGSDGGGEDEFQDKVLKGVETLTKSAEAERKRGDTLQKNIEKMMGDVERLDKETKDCLKDIETHKKVANDTASGINAMRQRFEMLDARLKMQARSSFGSPIQRLIDDPELNLRLNLAFRLAMDKNGDMNRICRSLVEKADTSYRGQVADCLKRALGEDSSPGSTVIDDRLSTEIYHTLQSYGIWNTWQVVPVGTKDTKFPVQTARVAAGFVLTESDTIGDDTTKAGSSVTATVEIIAALLNVSFQLLEDAEVDLVGNLMEDFGEAYAFVLDWACTQANGGADATDGGMTGVFGGGGTAAAAGTGVTTVEASSLADWQRCLLTVDPAVLQRPARWWMHPQILVRSLSVQDARGRPIFQTALEAPSAGAIGSILGYPITLGAQCPTTNAASAVVAVFGDPKGAVVGMRRQYMFESSDHHKWNTLQRSYRGWGRAAFKVRAATAFGALTLAAV